MDYGAQQGLYDFQPQHEFFVGIDSDGCVFNSMEVKHNDCFSVNLVKHFGLASISRQVHQAWDFVNLYSTTRGTNRFKAILLVCDFLREMPLVQNMGVAVPELPYLREWSETETKLGNPALQAAIDNATGERGDELSQVMKWSLGVNESVAEIVYNLPPFPGVRETLQRLQGKADVIVVSATPDEALQREWAEHGIDTYVAVIAGQEMGTKTEHLTITTKDRYAEHHVLMLGDSPGDLKAARDVGALFFPVNPGAEDASWQFFLDEAMGKFFNGGYAGAYETALIDKFQELLPETPPWQ
ncbi:MAG: HAD hydrolase-like protein [Candidatus Poribacteria bacterium]|nr:HAD hydrolase-like protein [Candidatus Poribacteria bacterium]